MKKTYKIEGMSCSACSNAVEGAVKKVDGVCSVSVSLLAKSMSVEFSEESCEQQIFSAVKKAGYKIASDMAIKKSYFKLRLILSLVLLLPLIYFSMGKMLGLKTVEGTINYLLQWLLATIIIALNFNFYINGTKALINKSPNMDTLVSLGSFFSYLFSVLSVIIFLINGNISGHLFFESSAMVLALVSLGKWLEEKSKNRTGDEIEALTKMLPENATVIRNQEEKLLPISQILAGDLVVLRAGNVSPIDGAVISGEGVVDKSAITGESMPVCVQENDRILSGTLLKSGYVIVKAEHVGESTVFSKIISSVKEAGASKAPVQRLADNISKIFVPIVFALAIITLLVWLLIKGDFYNSFNFAVNVLVISCPCALGLATPVAVMVTAGRGASLGILYKDATSIETAHNVNCVILDKTATLTVGKPEVCEFIIEDGYDSEQIKGICYALEHNSSHPLAESIKNFCLSKGQTVKDYKYINGVGVFGTIDDVEYKLGNFKVLDGAEQKDESDKTVLYLVANGKKLATFYISDTIKSDAFNTVVTLKAQGIKVIMATGDNYNVAKAVATKLEIEEFYANVLPEDKLNIVKKHQEQGYKVAMVGDGVNDSPALKSADLGIAMADGTDVATSSADVILIGGSLKSLTKSIMLSKKSFKIIKQNLFWAFFYNFFMIPVAAGALLPIGVAFMPWQAAGCMSISSLFVVLNALRIRGFAKTRPPRIRSIKLCVDKMMCLHCAGKVKKVLMSLNGTKKVKVELDKKLVRFKGSASEEEIKNAINGAGFVFIKVVE